MNTTKSPSFSDDWELHKTDFRVWRKFWALWELRRKWRWANSFYKRLDRVDNQIVESEAWGIGGGDKYMNLCLWTGLLRSLHEGITQGLDAFDTPANERVSIEEVLGLIPDNLRVFPTTLTDAFKGFRNAVFHCQWFPDSTKLKLDQPTTMQLEILHKDIGRWVNEQFEATYEVFKTKYDTPPVWVGVNFMSDDD